VLEDFWNLGSVRVFLSLLWASCEGLTFLTGQAQLLSNPCASQNGNGG
jgi:hypothetical protein